MAAAEVRVQGSEAGLQLWHTLQIKKLVDQHQQSPEIGFCTAHGHGARIERLLRPHLGFSLPLQPVQT
ncbi:hypothetical protein SDJN02_13083, partial [Cucurbita argyrosperma subsp. argyrosperma]